MSEASKTIEPFRNPRLDVNQRAQDLLSRLTLDEKCAQLTYEAPGVERVGMAPHNWWNECLHGVGRAGLATVFTQAIGLAATFDTALIHRVATAISDEARAKHHAHAARGDFGIYKGLTYWTPNINIFRDPRWGRGHETYGECPYLTARMGVAFVTGLQGDNPRTLKLVATPKHFAVHSGPEIGRHEFDAVVGPQDLNETYLPAFRATVQEGKAYSVMGAYNRLNGVPCCANTFLLDKILRDEWGFEGYTVSDCGAITDIHAHHKVTGSAVESAALAIKNGMDLCCGQDFQQLRKAVTEGLVSEAIIDRSVLRLLKARIRLGMFDPAGSSPYPDIPYEVVDSQKHRDLSLETARRSIVLLKNAGNLLPLRKDYRSIAVIGPNADVRQILLGNYHGTPAYTITPLDGIRAKLPETTRIHTATGTTHLATKGAWVGTADRGFVEAVMAAENSELTILCLGLTPTIEGEEGDAMNSEAGGDRTAIELPEIQRQLLAKIIETGKPIVLVLIGGSAMAAPQADEKVAAIIQQFYPGQDGGTALADVIFGDHNPAGRLPVTVYRQTADLPAFFDYRMDHRTYRFFDGPVLYPFGFGLSYSRFEYSNPRCDRSKIASGEGCRCSVTVRNVGTRDGDETAQLYVSHADKPFRVPVRQLAGIRCLHLKAGESIDVEFELSASQLDLINPEGKSVRVPGKVDVYIGGSQPDARSMQLGAAKPAHLSLLLG